MDRRLGNAGRIAKQHEKGLLIGVKELDMLMDEGLLYDGL
jgi:hypothetical protein